MTKPESAAFAKSAFYHPDGGVDSPNDGLTTREYFAALALQGMLAAGWNVHQYSDAAGYAVEAADALINQLNKKQTT